jgi:hypothetical protein
MSDAIGMATWIEIKPHSTTREAEEISKRRSMLPMDILAREDAQKPKNPKGNKHFRIFTVVSGVR